MKNKSKLKELKQWKGESVLQKVYYCKMGSHGKVS